MSRRRPGPRAAGPGPDLPSPRQAGALDELGLLQQLAGDYAAATDNLTQAVALYAELGDQRGQAYALNHLGLVHQDTGDFQAATLDIIVCLSRAPSGATLYAAACVAALWAQQAAAPPPPGRRSKPSPSYGKPSTAATARTRRTATATLTAFADTRTFVRCSERPGGTDRR